VAAFRDFAREARPEQWTKNLIVFAGLIFAGRLTLPEYVLRSILAFALFCLASSAIYVLNDLVDLEKDRLHPKKRERPVAAGRISKGAAAVFGAALAALALAGAFALSRPLALVVAAYLSTNILYSFYFKQAVVLDVLAIAVMFVLRAIAGVEVLRDLDSSIEISPWLLVCTLFLALFLGFGKRRHELRLLGGNAEGHRKTLAGYSLPFLDQMIGIVTAATLLAYSIYTVAPGTVAKLHTEALVYTIPFVVYGLFRYLYLLFEREGGGSPSESLLSDLPIVADVLLWIVTVGLLLYVFR
jgi:4-hydroxybenzoate polyprenyltransferase